ncbi:MAG: hypothetical protein HQK87_02500, partial [Nitrospinae bacterium]|nr:hypothetical protein [Nitrospinota bacterium]
MNRRIVIATAVALSLALPAGPTVRSARADIDQLTLDVTAGLELVRRWENVEESPYWLSGKDTAYSLGAGASLVSLEPGDRVTLHIPGGEKIMIRSFGDELKPEWFGGAVSNGSGMFVAIPVVPHAEDKHILYLDPARNDPSMVTVSRPESDDEAREVGLFVSRTQPAEEAVVYRDALSLDGTESVSLKAPFEGAATGYDLLVPGKDATLSISGPTRIRITSRYPFPKNESGVVTTYQITTRLDDEEPQTHTYQTGLDYRTEREMNGRPTPFGWPRYSYLHIPGDEKGEEKKQSPTPAAPVASGPAASDASKPSHPAAGEDFIAAGWKTLKTHGDASAFAVWKAGIVNAPADRFVFIASAYHQRMAALKKAHEVGESLYALVVPGVFENQDTYYLLIAPPADEIVSVQRQVQEKLGIVKMTGNRLGALRGSIGVAQDETVVAE